MQAYNSLLDIYLPRGVKRQALLGMLTLDCSRACSRSASVVAASSERGRSGSGGGSATRSSGSYDEAWFTDHTRREPVLAPPCVSAADVRLLSLAHRAFSIGCLTDRVTTLQIDNVN